MSEQPHCAVVTGASRGIGQAIARRLATSGIAVAVVSRTATANTAELAGSVQQTVDLITADGGKACGFVADLSDPDLDTAGLIALIEETMQNTVDILVNNAAATRRYGTLFADMHRDWFLDSVRTNLWAAWEWRSRFSPSRRSEARSAGRPPPPMPPLTPGCNRRLPR